MATLKTVLKSVLQVWDLIVPIPDLCTLTYFDLPGIAPVAVVPLLLGT